jgi:uncharacterized protein (TIGR02145 family)
MSFKCSIGFHSWDHCVCSSCGKKRDEQHLLTDDCEKCSKCGKEFENLHNWTRDCQECSKCRKRRNIEHSWARDCENCSNCSVSRINQHQLVNGICQVCGHGIFTDPSDGRTYKVIKIGTHVVMAENLNRLKDGGNHWSYENDDKNAVKNGFLYDQKTAKMLAPSGWHLPSKEEWESLIKSSGSNIKEVYDHIRTGGTSGFENVFGGWRFARGTFNSLGASAHYWSSTEEDEKEAWHFKVSAYKGEVEMEKVDKKAGLSVRYFMD